MDIVLGAALAIAGDLVATGIAYRFFRTLVGDGA
jgi:hypothetical protein